MENFSKIIRALAAKKKSLLLALGLMVCSTATWATDGALSGKFYIGFSERVVFSSGNLQYNAATDKWRFAEHQWDTIGIANENISSSYDGWIDLFGWGTGNNPTNHSETYESYPSFTDWGTNAIENGGQQAGLWRTLTEGEWNGIYYGNDKGIGTVEGVHGLILVPPYWEKPNGLSFEKDTHDWTTNNYSWLEWADMEASGAVFFPCAGYRSDSHIEEINERGKYWFSTTKFDKQGDSFVFHEGGTDDSNANERYRGFAVRLVKEYDDSATAIDETVNPQSSNRKFLRDGQLFIIRDGKVVNVLGQSVR